ncbi:hypothetical protein SADUNF_Sadunf06G0089100 [Salix dunnii]|uniref:K Homology domain-containing protein n=1 Tax=Salix dunnii TaxID=1413687 RepID=A0A835K891_9ROSI|nr:hypothetical protein SADUNF_Sadunf06G0089100 [Salix dunnii]
MSGLYNPNFSPARAASPQIRSTPDVDSQYLSELLAEHQKLGPFMQVLPVCSRLLNQGLLLGLSFLDPVIWYSTSLVGFRQHCGMNLYRHLKGLGNNYYINLSELSAEHRKLGPFMQVLPVCSRLLNQALQRDACRTLCKCGLEIFRVSGMMSNQGFGDFDRLRHRSPSPMASSNLLSNVGGTGLSGWNGLPQERLSGPPGMTMDWQGAPASPSSYTVKRILRLEIPVDTYPNVCTFNFVGRLLGPRGNSLKRVEATTGCRVYIRGKGSIKDPDKEEKLRGRPGYEHLNDPLHILIEADLPANIVDIRLRQAQEIIEELLKPVVSVSILDSSVY